MESPLEEGWSQILVDALLTSTGILNLVNLPDPTTLAAFDHIQAMSQKHQIHWFSAAQIAGEPVTAGVLGFTLQMALLHWFEGGAKDIARIPVLLDQLDLGLDQFKDQLIVSLVRALAPLAQSQVDNKHVTEDQRSEAAEWFRHVTKMLDEAGHVENAFKCASVTCNLIGSLTNPQFLPLAELALRLARQLPSERFIGLAEARRAAALAQAAEQGERTHLAAFDALLQALRNLPSEPQERNQAVGMIQPWIGDDRYSSLQPLYNLALVDNERLSISEQYGNPALILTPIADVDPDLWLLSVSWFLLMAMSVENGRLALDQQPENIVAEAEWASWSLRHATFRRAIPDSESLLRERDPHDLLLTLHHEITHIYSMVSQIGSAIIGLRAAALEVEASLWTFLSDDGQINVPQLLERGVAPLEGNILAALPQAEQALHINRKIQILQESWAPWFEGIAIFAELAADPTLDDKVRNPEIGVLAQMIDVRMDEEPDQRVKQALEHFGMVEQFYSEAIKNKGYFRLRTYLKTYFQHYLAGYLTVRSIVAAWRQTLGRPLSGTVAARVLLHITRFGTADTVPDLGMPLVTFQSEVHERLSQWLVRIAALSHEDLEFIIDSEQPSVWQDGHFITVDPQSESKNILDMIYRLAAQAYTSLVGDNADLDRVPDVDSRTKQLLRDVAQSLTKTQATLIDNLVNSYLSLPGVLPIAQVEVPFWLNRKRRSLCCLIRTIEQPKDNNEAGYNAIILPLGPKQYQDLEQEIATRGEPRMLAIRFADLMSPSVGMKGRGYGRNYLALCYGNWLHIEPRGIWFGDSDPIATSLVESIRSRTQRNPFISVEIEIMAAGLGGAHRTRHWLQTVDYDDEAYFMKPWAAYVAVLADEVLNPEQRTDRSVASLTMLRFVLGDIALAELLHQKGLDAVCEDGAQLRRLLKILAKSGLSPLPDDPADDVLAWNPLLIRTPSGWDVTPPKGLG